MASMKPISGTAGRPSVSLSLSSTLGGAPFAWTSGPMIPYRTAPSATAAKPAARVAKRRVLGFIFQAPRLQTADRVLYHDCEQNVGRTLHKRPRRHHGGDQHLHR